MHMQHGKGKYNEHDWHRPSNVQGLQTPLEWVSPGCIRRLSTTSKSAAENGLEMGQMFSLCLTLVLVVLVLILLCRAFNCPSADMGHGGACRPTWGPVWGQGKSNQCLDAIPNLALIQLALIQLAFPVKSIHCCFCKKVTALLQTSKLGRLRSLPSYCPGSVGSVSASAW